MAMLQGILHRLRTRIALRKLGKPKGQMLTQEELALLIRARLEARKRKPQRLKVTMSYRSAEGLVGLDWSKRALSDLDKAK